MNLVVAGRYQPSWTTAEDGNIGSLLSNLPHFAHIMPCVVAGCGNYVLPRTLAVPGATASGSRA